MYLWNKILLGVIIVAALGFFYMASRAAKIHSSWLKQAQKLETQIEEVKKENEKLLDGGGPNAPEDIGLRQARQELYRLTIERPRIWWNCDAQVNAAPQGLKITITTDKKPDPNGIAEGTALYAFEQSPAQNRGQYLGQFLAGKPAGRQVELTPATNLFERDLAKLTRAKKPWILCEYLPKDNREVYAKLTDDQKKAILPNETAKDYVRDGKPAEANDPATAKDAQGNYVRPLRDYGLLLSIYQERLNDLFDQTESLKRDVQYTKTAGDEASAMNLTLQKRIAELKVRKSETEEERNFIDRYRQQLASDIETLEKEFKTIIKENWTMAGRLAELQMEAAQHIEQRVRAVVQQSGNGLK
jgi:hypothetical protein